LPWAIITDIPADVCFFLFKFWNGSRTMANQYYLIRKLKLFWALKKETGFIVTLKNITAWQAWMGLLFPKQV
jgi:hypothetical protein